MTHVTCASYPLYQLLRKIKIFEGLDVHVHAMQQLKELQLNALALMKSNHAYGRGVVFTIDKNDIGTMWALNPIYVEGNNYVIRYNAKILLQPTCLRPCKKEICGVW